MYAIFCVSSPFPIDFLIVSLHDPDVDLDPEPPGWPVRQNSNSGLRFESIVSRRQLEVAFARRM